MSKYTDAQLKEVFGKFDTDNSGSISIKELEAVIKSLGVEPADAKTISEGIISDCDKDQNGSINFEEFKAGMA